MDWLIEIAADLEKEVFWQVATLLDHEVDLLFFDTTSTYFEIEEPDDPVARDQQGHRIADHTTDTGEETVEDGNRGGVGFRTHGKSKDSRDDLP